MTGITRPTGEQLRFNSSKTGSHILDDYLEAVEFGSKRLDELLAQLFDSNGDFDGALFEFRVDPSGGDFEYRVGQFIDPDSGWMSTGQTIFNPRGNHAAGQTYARLDCVTYVNEFYVCVTPHTSTPSLDPSKWAKVLDENPLNVAVETAEFYAAQATAAAASVTGAVNIPTQNFSGTGAQTAFTLTLQPSSAEALLVTVDHIVQQPTVAYTLSGNTLTFTAAPANGTVITVRYLGGSLNQMPVQPRTGTYTLPASDGFKVQNCSASLTANLPSVASAGNGFLVIYKTNGFTITIDPASTEQIDGLATKAFGTDFFLWCDGTKWISFAPQGAISTVFGRVGAVTAQANDYTATQITNTPSGSIGATNVQAALNELDADITALASATTTSLAGKQPLDATLTAIAGAATGANILHYFSGTDTVATATLSAFGRSLVDDADEAAGRSTLGLGSLSTLNAVNTAQVTDDAITNAKLANMATGTIKGRLTASTGDPEDLTGTQVTTMLDVFTSTLKGLVPASGGGTANFLRADGTWAAPPGGGGGVTDGDKGDITVSASGATWTIDANAVTLAKMAQIATDTLLGRDTAGTGNVEAITLNATLSFTGAGAIQRAALTGDVTASAGSNATTIANDAVTNAKLANMVTARIKGRITASTGDPEDLTGTQVTTMLDVFTTSLKGLVPASGGGTTNFLRADGTWAAPSGGGGVTDGDKGDIVVSSSGAVWLLEAGSVSNSKLASVPDGTIKANLTGTSAPPGDYDLATISEFLIPFVGATSGANGKRGVVPQPNAGDQTKFLKADGTWAVPAGGSATPGGSSGQMQYNNAGAFAGTTGLTWDNALTHLIFGTLANNAWLRTPGGPANVDGVDLHINTGEGGGTFGSGGDIWMQSGFGGTEGYGGNVNILAGNSGDTAGDGGVVLIRGGNSGNGLAGHIYLDPGNNTDSGADGRIIGVDRFGGEATLFDENMVMPVERLDVSNGLDLDFEDLWYARLMAAHEGVQSPAIIAGAVTLNYQFGNVFIIAMNQNATINVTDVPPEASSITLIVVQDGFGPWLLGYPTNTAWPGGTSGIPTLTNNPGAYDVITLFTADGGDSWFGGVVGQNYQVPA